MPSWWNVEVARCPKLLWFRAVDWQKYLVSSYRQLFSKTL